MADREKRARRAAERHESREARLESWLDRKVTSRGMRPRYAAYLVVTVWVAAIVVFGIVIRAVDPHTFKTIWLAWWWAIQTVTTVGYGDVVPQQTAGKAIAAVLMLGGLSFLSVLTATITSAFVSRRQRQAQERGDDPIMRELASISQRLESLEEELRQARTGAGGESGPGPPPD
jgi:voltage-gated potassium channel